MKKIQFTSACCVVFPVFFKLYLSIPTMIKIIELTFQKLVIKDKYSSLLNISIFLFLKVPDL